MPWTLIWLDLDMSLLRYVRLSVVVSALFGGYTALTSGCGAGHWASARWACAWSASPARESTSATPSCASCRFWFQFFWVDVLFALFTDRNQRAFELLSKTRVVDAERDPL